MSFRLIEFSLREQTRLEAELLTLRAENEALKKERDELAAALAGERETEGCRRCEGNGALWADGKAHLPSYNGATVRCPECGGDGRTILPLTVDPKSVLDAHDKEVVIQRDKEIADTLSSLGALVAMKDQQIAELAAALENADCPECGGAGETVRGVEAERPERHQCDWCKTQRLAWTILATHDAPLLAKAAYWRNVADMANDEQYGRPCNPDPDVEKWLKERDAAVVEPLVEALRPFGSGGPIDSILRGDFSIMRERLVDWFGPSDFKRAHTALAPYKDPPTFKNGN